MRKLRPLFEPFVDGQVVETRYGIRFPVRPDPMYRQLVFFGDYEPNNTHAYRRLVRPGDVVIDIGANFGWYSVLLGKEVAPTGCVHAFEPIVEFQEQLARALELNNMTDVVQCHHVALGARAGRLTIYTFENLPQGHASSSNLGRADAVPNSCEVVTLDSFVEKHGIRAQFLKIDVEGHEPFVFEGAQQTLGAADAPLVAFEVNIRCLASNEFQPRDVESVLRGLGYTHFFRPIRSGLAEVHELMPATNADYVAAKPWQMPRIEPLV